MKKSTREKLTEIVADLQAIHAALAAMSNQKDLTDEEFIFIEQAARRCENAHEELAAFSAAE